MQPNSALSSCRCYTDGLTPLNWQTLFARPAPVEVDVGCGKGRFLLARAQANSSLNFLGLDRMLQRIRRVDRKVARLGLANVRLMRMEAYYTITYLIAPASVRTYYIFFPDPWPKKKHHNHRLFNNLFMDALYRTLEPGGCVHIATDHLPYFDEVVSSFVAEGERFVESNPAFEPSDAEKTDFELLYIGQKPIGRASFIKRA